MRRGAIVGIARGGDRVKFRPFAKKTHPAGAAPAADALTRFRSGDALAFDEIVDAHAPGIVRLFRRHGVDALDGG